MFFEEENEEIIDIAIEILDQHFGYDEDFFCDSDGFPANGETNTKFYKDMMGYDGTEDGIFQQAEKAQQEGCTVEEIKEEEKIPESEHPNMIPGGSIFNIWMLGKNEFLIWAYLSKSCLKNIVK